MTFSINQAGEDLLSSEQGSLKACMFYLFFWFKENDSVIELPLRDCGSLVITQSFKSDVLE